MIKTHLSLNVADLDRALAFYTAFFGVQPHKVRPGYANFDLVEPPLKFALNERVVEGGKGGLDHLGFQMSTVEQVFAAKERLQAAGLATFDELDTTCCYAKQDKIWVHDPDGNEWEVYVLTDDLLDDHEHNHAGDLIATHGVTPIALHPSPPVLALQAVNPRADDCCQGS